MKNTLRNYLKFLFIALFFISGCTEPDLNITGQDGKSSTTTKGTAVLQIVSALGYPQELVGAGKISTIDFSASLNGEYSIVQSLSDFNEFVQITEVKPGKWMYEIRAYDSNSKMYQYSGGELVIPAGIKKEPIIITLEQVKVTPISIIPNENEISAENKISLSTLTADSKIFYTIDGSSPSNGIEYNEPFTLPKGSVTIRAIAKKGILSSSNEITKNFTVTDKPATPVFTPASGTYGLAQQFTITCDSAGTSVYYTTDGSEPTKSSTLYNSSFGFDSVGGYVVKAIAFKGDKQSSTATINIDIVNSVEKVKTPVFSPASATYSLEEFSGMTITSSTANANIYYTIDGSTPDSNSTKYSSSVSFGAGTYTVKAVAKSDGLLDSSIASASYTITSGGNPVLTEVNVKFGKAAMVEDEVYRFTGEAKYSTGVSSEDVSWEVSDETLGTITLDGTFTANKAGTIIIYAKKGSMKSTGYSVVISAKEAEGIKIYIDETFGNQLYAWLDGNVKLLGDWPGTKLNTAKTVVGEGKNIVIGKTAHYYTVLFVDRTKINCLVLKDGTKKTAEDQVITGTVTYNANGDKTNGTPNDIGPKVPKVSASPAGGVKVAGTYSVSLSVDAGASASKYTINGSNPETSGINFSNGDNVSITLNTGSVVVLKLFATNSEGSTTETYTFTEGAAPTSVFSWDNVNCYFVLTDRFVNGDKSNDHSYGRECDQSGNIIQNSGYEDRPGTFNGGDLKGLTSKVVDGYFTDLGVNAIWITSPLEQIHGWVAGGGPSGSFKHYGYHGYYVLDPTEIDANMGTEQDFKNFMKAAHDADIRVVIDVVINHFGYENLKDMDEYSYGGLKAGWKDYYYNATDSNASWDNGLAPVMDLQTSNWSQWWGPDWVRKNDVGGGYDPMGASPLGQYNYNLPDLKTESSKTVALPPLLVTKWNKMGNGKYQREVDELDAFFTRTGKSRTPRNYVIKWMTDLIRKYGVDGFRLDTVNNLDMASVADLALTCKSEFNYVKQTNPSLLLDPAADFWMTGESYDHGVYKSDKFTVGKLDSIINFNFPKDGNLGSIGGTWSSYASSINNDSSFNVLSYLSSHDKGLTRGNMKNLGTALLLSPGGVQIYYGDETARPASVGGEPGWRSKMNWGQNTDILTHWQKVGSFRRDHVSVGAGANGDLGSNTYSRAYNKNGIEDKVIIKLNGGGAISVGSVFADGTNVRDAYTGNLAVVSGGKVSFTDGGANVILIEEVK